MATGNKHKQNGRDLMLFIDMDTTGTSPSYKAIAFASSHSLSISTETTDTSTKDDGRYGSIEAQKLTWSISCENAYSEDYATLFDKMKDMNPIEVRFGLLDSTQISNPDAVSKSVDTTNGVDWALGTTYYKGEAFISSLNLTANNGEKATFSMELSGTGAITRVQ